MKLPKILSFIINVQSQGGSMPLIKNDSPKLGITVNMCGYTKQLRTRDIFLETIRQGKLDGLTKYDLTGNHIDRAMVNLAREKLGWN